MGIDLSFSSAFHPQTNGQTERTNQTLETYLRCFVSADQDDWVSFLPLAEFALNNRASSATLVSPFFCNSGFHPRFSSGQVESSDCPGVDTVVDRLQQIWTHVVDNLTLSQEKAQRFANRRRCVGPRLRVGDLVWLSSRHIPMKVSSPKFKPRFIGPYRISEVLNPVSFRLTLPDSFSIHNVFHRSLLRRYVAPVVPSVDPPAPVLVEGELEYIVEKILDSRVSRRKLQYLVKWKGYAQEDNSWVFASDVHAPDLVRAFHMAHPGRPGSSDSPPEGGRITRLFTRNTEHDGAGFEYSMFYNADERRMICIFQPGPFLEGPPGFTHGGCIATILDSTLGAGAVYIAGPVMTANLNIDYRNPIPLGCTVIVDSHVEKEEGRKVYARGQIRSHDDQLLHTEAT
ncbi:unnamed protein product, partial [Ranitomeya imitator]